MANTSILSFVCLILACSHFVSSTIYKNTNDGSLHTTISDNFRQEVFIQELFTKYGNGTVMTYEGFEHLMNGIELGNIILDDPLSAHHELNNTDFKSLHNENHSHVVDITKPLDRHRRHAEHDHSHEHIDDEDGIINTCLSPERLLELYNIEQTDVITKKDFLLICPALISQLDQKKCLEMDILILYRSYELPKSVGQKAWIYGLVCMLIISFAGLLVVVLVPLLQRISFDGILQCLISMAVGALTGDAFLHLLPHALAPHAQTGHDHDSESHHNENVYKGLCGLSAMYFFFLIGRIQTIIGSKKKKVNNNKKKKIPEYKKRLNSDGIELVDVEREFEVHSSDHHGHSHSNVTSVSGMVWRVIVGDGIHNFSDGLAIGVAFANSITGGISTAIAVLCHELPHEMGDFAMLLKKGMSIKRAICFNCLSSILSLIGMVIGVAVGNIGIASIWIFVAIAGMFIYISLVDMIPELTIIPEKEKNSWKRLIVQMLGLSAGTGIMLAIAVFEEELKTMLQ